MSRVGYLGPKGTFTEMAAEEYRGTVAEYIPYCDIKVLVKAVVDEKIDRAVVPIENSLQGAVTLTLDLLLKYDLKIVDEVIIPITHSLLAADVVTDLDDLDHVVSHPQALAQCRAFIDEHLNCNVHTADSTADAIKRVAKAGPNWAAIGNYHAADYYDLSVLRNDIQDNEENWTRFVVLAKEDSPQTGDDKTSIICSPRDDHPGALYEILKEFAQREINLTRIESRPARKMIGDYIFFIDFEGHRSEENIQLALSNVEEIVAWIKLLGSYPQAEIQAD
ncbi:prephenate dehydratase [Halanaerobacter jeridensis]|uniref:Prephenate dehydratase n=1 Tax=Halanaerobacter jeridensis TaxID=706427 RepID=A0A939BRQ5_9FIRM|nr:prephenate dehydratase [Halanaerobacter jeridensis]